MKKLNTILFALSLTGLSCLAAAQQNEASSKEFNRKKDNVETIEVVGRKTLGRLQIEVSDNAYAVATLFNQFVDDDDLRFYCKKKQLQGSHRKAEACESGFEKRIREELQAEAIRAAGTVDFSTLNQANVFSRVGTKELDEKRREQQALMAELTQTNPEFLAAIVRFNKSKEVLHQNHERVYGKLSTIRENAENDKTY